MMSIKPLKACLSQDVNAKVAAAVKQMTDLIAHVDQWVEYRLLSAVDRQQLIQKGFARDLVENLVYFTQRFGKDDVTIASDHLVLGFTEAAFDPSLYGCESITNNLRSLTLGRCSWCESLIAHSEGVVSHYRPPAGYSENNILYRNAYYSLAYDQSNLMYSCRACSEKYKTDYFPVLGNGRMPKVSLLEESPVLINPYIDDPRQYIRFNPLNAQAYAYDRVVKFYNETQNKSVSEVEILLCQSPESIPEQVDSQGNKISVAKVDSCFALWLDKQSGINGKILSRGQLSINILGLNRHSLVQARTNHLRYIRGLYLAQKNPQEFCSQEISEIDTLIDSLTNSSGEQNKKCLQYLSLTMDAINTWTTECSSVTANSGA